MRGLLLCLFLVFAGFRQDSVEDMLLGKWTYQKGTYEYYDADGRKLKESAMNAINGLEIQLNKDNVAIISFSKAKSRTSNYSVSKAENGKYFINTNLSGNPFKYEVATVTESSLVLLSKTNAGFFIDGDVNKKVSYCLVKIYLAKKPAG